MNNLETVADSGVKWLTSRVPPLNRRTPERSGWTEHALITISHTCKMDERLPASPFFESAKNSCLQNR